MVSYEEFEKRFPDSESFEKEFFVGKKVWWSDRNKYTVVGHFVDVMKKYEEHLVIIKRWLKTKKCWDYHLVNDYLFYAVVEMMEREMKD